MKMRSPTLSAFCTRSPIGHFRLVSAQSRPRCSAWTFEDSSFSLPLYCSPISFSITFGVHVEQRRQRADIDDVLEQLALARIGVCRVADRGQRHADHGDVVAELRARHRLGGVVEQVAAGLDRGDVLVEGLRVHRDHHVDAAAGAEMAVLGDAHLVPGRQALDVGREDVARRDRHAHAQDRAREQLVGAGRARAVDVGEADDEVVYAADRAGTGMVFRRESCRSDTSACPRRRSGSVRRTARNAGRRPRPSPSRGRSSGRRRHRGPGSRLLAGACSRVRRSASSPFGVKVMQSIGQMSTQASHSMQSCEANTVCTSQFRQRCASPSASLRS